MDPQIKQQWVEALRSSQYTQGTRALQDHFGNFCCLGVLADLYIKEHDDVKWDETSSREFGVQEVHDGELVMESGMLPNIVAQWAGLPKNPTVMTNIIDPDRGTSPLSEINDAGYDFDKIATLIEEKL